MHRYPFLLLLLILALAACPMKSAIWIVAGSTREHLEFGISDKRFGNNSIQWGLLVVRDCTPGGGEATQKTYWVLERKPENWNGNWPNRVRYGQTPIDFKTTVGVEQLASGCYEASVIGTGQVRFLIDSAGAVRELSSSEDRGAANTPSSGSTEFNEPAA